MLAAPSLRDGDPVGTIAIGRAHAGPFPESQIRLLKAFAAQAVIAIENAHLFEEVRTRNRGLMAPGLIVRTFVPGFLNVNTVGPPIRLIDGSSMPQVGLWRCNSRRAPEESSA